MDYIAGICDDALDWMEVPKIEMEDLKCAMKIERMDGYDQMEEYKERFLNHSEEEYCDTLLVEHETME